MTLRQRLLIVAGVLAFVVLLAGIPFAFPVPDGAPVAEPVEATPSSTPSTVIWDVPPYDGPASCTNLVDPNTALMFADRAWQESAVDTARQFGPGWDPYEFYENGGLACAWGSETVEYTYAYSPLDARQAEGLKAKLLQSGFTKGDEGAPKYLMTDGNERYIFADGFWVYARSEDPHLVDQVYEHVPERGNRERTDLQDAIYVTSEGIGDLRIGETIPRSTTIAYWNADVCGPGQGVWAPSGTFQFDGNTRTVEFATADGERDGELRGIRILTPTIPTKSGLRVGDPVQRVLDTLGFEGTSDLVDSISLDGTAGTIAFQFGSPGPGDPRVVLAIYVAAFPDPIPTLETRDCSS